MREDDTTVIHLKDYRPPDFLISTVDLDFRLDPEATIVHARYEMSRNPDGDPAAPLVLDGDALELVAIAVDGTPLDPSSYDLDKTGLTLRKSPGDRFTLDVTTRINPTANTQLSGLYRSSGTYCTQCEAEGFRRITYFLDRPDVLAVYTTRIEADKATTPVLLANGNPVEAGDVPGTGRHYVVWSDPFPKPSYLFALVGGDLAEVRDSYVTGSGRKVDLRVYVEHGNEPRCDYAIDALKRAMRWDEEVFGREYDLDLFMIVAVDAFNFGAMENKGLN
ncbi:MAG: aminopeptidase N, partial [Hyphomicrobiales bacterium]|nr:aminopeptidase N [Hyphomicrobiales bacterium]